MKTLEFLKVLNSPFKPFRLKFYFGKVAIGTPLFLPRRWVNYTKKEAHEYATDFLTRQANHGIMTGCTYEELYENKLNSKHAITKKIGFDLLGLGWKTKWDQYRFEWNPKLSFVFFNWQFVVIVDAPESDHYWEAWLYYYYETDKSLSKKERIQLCKENYNLTWKSSNGYTINYYDVILKDIYK